MVPEGGSRIPTADGLSFAPELVRFWRGLAEPHDPPRAGGSGLTPSPGSSLARDTPGYVDYLDASGRWVGTGAAPPPGTVYVRRWAVVIHSAGRDDLRVLHVVVMSLSTALRLSGAFRPEAPGVTWLATLRARV